MAGPLAILKGISMAAPLIGGLFKKGRKYGDIPEPEFFGQDFERLLGATKQRDQAAFADADTQIRDVLADAGLLRSGALPDALVRSSIAQGQQIAGDVAGLTSQEYGSQRNFDINRFNALFGAQEQQKERDFKDDSDFLSQLGISAENFGDYIAKKKKKKDEDEDE
jgi:hypothetical protein